MSERRFPPPWSFEKKEQARFVVINGGRTEVSRRFCVTDITSATWIARQT
jgi:hypothetical protein